MLNLHRDVQGEAPTDGWTSGSTRSASRGLTAAEDIHPRAVPERHLHSAHTEESEAAGAPAAFCPAAAEQLHRCVAPWRSIVCTPSTGRGDRSSRVCQLIANSGSPGDSGGRCKSHFHPTFTLLFQQPLFPFLTLPPSHYPPSLCPPPKSGPSLSLLDQITVDSHSLARDQFLWGLSECDFKGGGWDWNEKLLLQRQQKEGKGGEAALLPRVSTLMAGAQQRQYHLDGRWNCILLMASFGYLHTYCSFSSDSSLVLAITVVCLWEETF